MNKDINTISITSSPIVLLVNFFAINFPTGNIKMRPTIIKLNEGAIEKCSLIKLPNPVCGQKNDLTTYFKSLKLLILNNNQPILTIKKA